MNDNLQLNEELKRQQKEAVEIGKVIGIIARDMSRARNVNIDFTSNELIAHALLMSKNLHKQLHEDLIQEHGSHGITEFETVFSNLALKKLIGGGKKVSKNKVNPSIFDILSNDSLTNQDLAQSLYSAGGLSIENVSERGFFVGREGEFFKITVAVHKDAISLFTYHDEPNMDIEENAVACARYNDKTNYSKAQIVTADEFQIHFNYIYPHSGKVFVTDIKRLISEFIDEHCKYARDIW